VGRPVAPIETFCSIPWLAGWLAGWLDFDGFSEIWCHNVLQPGTTLWGDHFYGFVWFFMDLVS